MEGGGAEGTFWDTRGSCRVVLFYFVFQFFLERYFSSLVRFNLRISSICMKTSKGSSGMLVVALVSSKDGGLDVSDFPVSYGVCPVRAVLSASRVSPLDLPARE